MSGRSCVPRESGSSCESCHGRKVKCSRSVAFCRWRIVEELGMDAGLYEEIATLWDRIPPGSTREQVLGLAEGSLSKRAGPVPDTPRTVKKPRFDPPLVIRVPPKAKRGAERRKLVAAAVEEFRQLAVALEDAQEEADRAHLVSSVPPDLLNRG